MGQEVRSKACNNCLEEKPLFAFSKVHSQKSVYRTYCKPCGVKMVQAARAKDRNWWRRFHLKKHFGMTLEDWNGMLDAQEYKCAICLESFDLEVQSRRPNLDHDHRTGKVRKALCFGCNTMLGKAGDSISVLESAIKYLKEHASE